AAARNLGLSMSMHLGMNDGFPPRGSIQLLDENGLLGEDMQFVHCCTSTDEELERLAQVGGSIAISPIAGILGAIGAPPTGRARKAGLRPGLGADAVSASSGDLFDEARTALTAERALQARSLFNANHEVSDTAELGMSALDALHAVTVDAA